GDVDGIPSQPLVNSSQLVQGSIASAPATEQFARDFLERKGQATISKLPKSYVKAGTKWALPHFWCNPAADWRNPLESREPLCDRFAWGFSVCGDFFEASGWSFAVRSFRRHTLPSPSRARRSVHRVLRAAVSPAAGTAAIPGS